MSKRPGIFYYNPHNVRVMLQKFQGAVLVSLWTMLVKRRLKIHRILGSIAGDSPWISL